MRGDICAQCCGAEREVTISCPLECDYLQESRLHEKSAQVDPATLPNADIEVTEEFLGRNEFLLAFFTQAILDAAIKTENTLDRDVREALSAIVQTYRTKHSGLVYETRPDNVIAAGIQKLVSGNLERLEAAIRERPDGAQLRDADVLGCVVFLERLAVVWDNRRPRGRAFLSMLWKQHGVMSQAVAERGGGSGGLILP